MTQTTRRNYLEIVGWLLTNGLTLREVQAATLQYFMRPDEQEPGRIRLSHPEADPLRVELTLDEVADMLLSASEQGEIDHTEKQCMELAAQLFALPEPETLVAA